MCGGILGSNELEQVNTTYNNKAHKQLNEGSQAPQNVHLYKWFHLYKFDNRQNENIMKEIRKWFPVRIVTERVHRAFWDADDAVYLDVYFAELTLWKFIKLYLYDKCNLSVRSFYSI